MVQLRVGLHLQVSKTKPPQLRPYSEDAAAKADKEARWKAQALRHVEADELRAIASAATQGPSVLLQHVYQVRELPAASSAEPGFGSAAIKYRVHGRIAGGRRILANLHSSHLLR